MNTTLLNQWNVLNHQQAELKPLLNQIPLQATTILYREPTHQQLVWATTFQLCAHDFTWRSQAQYHVEALDDAAISLTSLKQLVQVYQTLTTRDDIEQTRQLLFMAIVKLLHEFSGHQIDLTQVSKLTIDSLMNMSGQQLRRILAGSYQKNIDEYRQSQFSLADLKTFAQQTLRMAIGLLIEPKLPFDQTALRQQTHR